MCVGFDWVHTDSANQSDGRGEWDDQVSGGLPARLAIEARVIAFTTHTQGMNTELSACSSFGFTAQMAFELGMYTCRSLHFSA